MPIHSDKTITAEFPGADSAAPAAYTSRAVSDGSDISGRLLAAPLARGDFFAVVPAQAVAA